MVLPTKGSTGTYHNWQVQGRSMTGFLQEGTGTVLVSLETTLEKFEADLLREQQEVQARKEVRGHVTRWKTKQGILHVKGNEPTGEASPTSPGMGYEEMLQDVRAIGRWLLFAGREHLREALSVCARYVSLFHCLTAEDLWLWFVGCCLFWGAFVFFLCFARMRSSSFDRSWVTATCCPLTFCHITTVSAVMVRTTMVQKEKLQTPSSGRLS